MFSSWDLVRPRFWYSMSSLEQSMMELEHMSDSIMRPQSLFDMRRDIFAAPKHVEGKEGPLDDDFFVDLPVVPHMYKPTSFHTAPKQGEKVLMNKDSADNVSSDIDTSTDMEIDDKGNEKVDQAEGSGTKPVKTSKKVDGNDKTKETHCNKNKQLCHESCKVTPTIEHKVAPKSDAECRNFSSYSFSSSSVLDDMGRRVTTTRRRYEDSNGQLKAVHEREIDGKKLRTTWRRQNTTEEGQHESICSTGNPDEFEELWQQTPFGQAQKNTVKGQIQSELVVEKNAGGHHHCEKPSDEDIGEEG
ncbi:unnamed protein product [Peronospora destructor]|uniref:Uncharacterized protein n=1 Tax=Peronospora destructor TaxID=86335 RepID=A0AAV0TU56_9STRA|nr:unnamed protein product [Peronospora destructor]